MRQPLRDWSWDSSGQRKDGHWIRTRERFRTQNVYRWERSNQKASTPVSHYSLFPIKALKYSWPWQINNMLLLSLLYKFKAWKLITTFLLHLLLLLRQQELSRFLIRRYLLLLYMAYHLLLLLPITTVQLELPPLHIHPRFSIVSYYSMRHRQMQRQGRARIQPRMIQQLWR